MTTQVEKPGAVGVLEFYSVASAITAADVAAKAANITLIEVRIGYAIGGKGYVTDVYKRQAMILATGGSAMVRAAYSSGTPAIGVGPGNGPAYLEKTCDLPLAVKRIMDSKTFDNGTICASEQSIICDEDMAVSYTHLNQL